MRFIFKDGLYGLSAILAHLSRCSLHYLQFLHTWIQIALFSVSWFLVTWKWECGSNCKSSASWSFYIYIYTHTYSLPFTILKTENRLLRSTSHRSVCLNPPLSTNEPMIDFHGIWHKCYAFRDQLKSHGRSLRNSMVGETQSPLKPEFWYHVC